MYPQCTKIDDCRGTVPYFKLDLCRCCYSYQAEDMQIDLDYIIQPMPKSSLRQQIDNLRVELSLQNNILNKHLDFSSKKKKEVTTLKAIEI